MSIVWEDLFQEFEHNYFIRSTHAESVYSNLICSWLPLSQLVATVLLVLCMCTGKKMILKEVFLLTCDG